MCKCWIKTHASKPWNNTSEGNLFWNPRDGLNYYLLVALKTEEMIAGWGKWVSL